MKRMTITVGAGKDWRGSELEPDDKQIGLTAIRDTLVKHFGGYTEEIVHGGWLKGGRTVEEPGRRFVVLAPEDADGDDVARFIGRAMHQQAVMLEVEPLIENSGIVPVW